MIVLAFPANEAERIRTGEQTVMTYAGVDGFMTFLRTPEGRMVALTDLEGQPVAIARLPDRAPLTVPTIEVQSRTGLNLWQESSGAIVGSATVAAVEKVERFTDLTYLYPNVDFTPGRWAVILTDAAPCEQRCPWCCTTRDGYTLRDDGRATCPVCHDKTICAPIPCSADGPFSEWTP